MNAMYVFPEKNINLKFGNKMCIKNRTNNIAYLLNFAFLFCDIVSSFSFQIKKVVNDYDC